MKHVVHIYFDMSSVLLDSLIEYLIAPWARQDHVARVKGRIEIKLDALPLMFEITKYLCLAHLDRGLQ